ncbi:MAG: DUF4476 domain-containing protein [Bacteroidota bacterium]
MKNIFSLLLTVFIFNSIVAQNNHLIVYSQEGLKFSVILNGIRQNSDLETNVKITGLNAPNYQVKITFANKMPDLDENVYLMYGGEQTQNTEYTYSIAKVKEKYKLKFRSAAPIPEVVNTVGVPEQEILIFTPIERSTTRTTTTTTTTNSMDPNYVNMGIGMNGVNMNMNINVNDMESMGGTSNGSTTTTYSTTTTTTSGGGGNGNYQNTNNNNNNNSYVLQGYNGVYGCPYPMGSSDFESAKASIKSKSFDDSKLTLAKQIIGSNCMLCSQIKELMLLITFEQTRLDLAKYAWHHNLDKGNYYKLNDAFTFESSIDELNKYTQTH